MSYLKLKAKPKPSVCEFTAKTMYIGSYFLPVGPCNEGRDQVSDWNQVYRNKFSTETLQIWSDLDPGLSFLPEPSIPKYIFDRNLAYYQPVEFRRRNEFRPEPGIPESILAGTLCVTDRVPNPGLSFRPETSIPESILAGTLCVYNQGSDPRIPFPAGTRYTGINFGRNLMRNRPRS